MKRTLLLSVVAGALALSGAIMRARWAEERDIADPATLAEVAVAKGLDAVALAADAGTPGIAAARRAPTISASSAA